MVGTLISVLIAVQAANSPGAPPTALRQPEPISPIPSLFTASDYPPQAAAKRKQGITDFRLQVGANGRVEKCSVERSSGSAALDRAACQVITRRARFRPATDRSGNPIEGVYLGMVHWML